VLSIVQFGIFLGRCGGGSWLLLLLLLLFGRGGFAIVIISGRYGRRPVLVNAVHLHVVSGNLTRAFPNAALRNGKLAVQFRQASTQTQCHVLQEGLTAIVVVVVLLLLQRC